MLLLFVLFSFALCLGGCGRRGGEVYVAGLETEFSAETERREGGSPDGGVLKADAESGAGNSQTERSGSDSGSENTAGEDESTLRETEGYVYVCGAVNCPGVYPMHSGMRVFEAVELAGGFAENADEEWLNQAGQLQDGQQLYICTKDETQQMREDGSTGSALPQGNVMGTGSVMPQGAASGAGNTAQQTDAGAADGKVNLNTADIGTLMTLPGIGEVKAEAIIQYRTEHGGFSSIEEIQNIPGIKQAIFSKIADRITV